VLFFAYGGLQLNRFLSEAAAAARSFRQHNPDLQIGIVTNNATVDARIFNVHVPVRADLLFQGDTTNGGQNRPDRIPRQWLTRLYYLAHSPFEITWALDSNAVSCTPGAAQAFLDAALATRLWGFDICQASQAHGKAMYPHNWNIVYRWSSATRALLRDWFLLQIRRGVTFDDQRTLHTAELRSVAAGFLKVGQVSSTFAAAFVPTFDGRLTRRIVGRAHIFHHVNHSLCNVVNERPHNESSAERPRQLLLRNRQYHWLHSVAECDRALNEGSPAEGTLKRHCRLHEVEPPAPHGALVMGASPVFAATLETLRQFAASKRCGEDCTAVVDSVVAPTPSPARRELMNVEASS